MSTTMISIRVPDDDLAAIDQAADALGLNRTAFLLRAALGRVTAAEQRLADLDRRLSRVEERQDLGF